MALTVNSNPAALIAYRNLAGTQALLSEAMQRLSSGMRINSSADDAAGLAIEQGLTAQINGNRQAIRNTQDGINLVQTADGALAGSQDILQRMRTLAVQAANDSNDPADRADMQAEIDQLNDQLDQIAGKTAFNGIPLLDGSFVDKLLQVGYASDDTLGISLPGVSLNGVGYVPSRGYAVGTAGTWFARQSDGNWLGTGMTDADGNVGTLGDVTFSVGDESSHKDATKYSVTVDLSEADGTPQSVVGLLNEQFAADGGKLTASWDRYTGSVQVRSTFATDDPVLATGGGFTTDQTGYYQAEGSPSGLFFTTGNEPVGAAYDEGQLKWTATTTDGANVSDLTKVTHISLTLDGFNQNGSGTDASGDDEPVTFEIDINPGDFASSDDYASLTGKIQDALDSDTRTAGRYAVTTTPYGAPWVDTNDSMHEVEYYGYHAHGWNRTGIEIRNVWPVDEPDEVDPMSIAFTLDDGTTLPTVQSWSGLAPTGYGTETGSWVDVVGGFSSRGLHTREGVNVLTQENAEHSIESIDSAIQALSTTRAYLGATQNRLQSTMSSLTTSADDLDASRSSIADADMAVESSKLSRAQVLEQAGTAMLKQANQAPNMVLQLLQS